LLSEGQADRKNQQGGLSQEFERYFHLIGWL